MKLLLTSPVDLMDENGFTMVRYELQFSSSSEVSKLNISFNTYVIHFFLSCLGDSSFLTVLKSLLFVLHRGIIKKDSCSFFSSVSPGTALDIANGNTVGK